MLDVFFADDARQRDPYRPGMTSLVGTGFLHVPGDAVRDLEAELWELCDDTGFPDGDEGEFKWSPDADLWMYDNLVDQAREDFFTEALETARDHGASFTVVVDDVSGRTATDATNHQMDVTNMLIERAQWELDHEDRTGMVVVDRPSGGRADETDFLRDCLETLTEGTDYLGLERIAFNVVSTPSRLIRCLQLADIVTSCTVSRIAGENNWSPPVFEEIQEGLVERGGQVPGTGLKIHPTLRYMNLYHWLLDTDVLMQRARRRDYHLPDPQRPYSDGPMTE